MVGYAEEFFSGMVSPLFNGTGDGWGGAASSMCCEPSRLVWPILAVALAGSLTVGSTSSVSTAIQFFNSMARTLPTKTSATRTRLLTLSASVSGICT